MTHLDDDFLPEVTGPPLSDNARHVLNDEDGIPYLRISFDNKPNCSLTRDYRLNLDKNEMDLFSQNILLDVEEAMKELPRFEYIVIYMFDFETREILNTYVKH